MITYHENDIGRQLATDAHSGTSMVPEKRAQSVLTEYTSHMQAVATEFEQWVTDENREAMEEDLEAYRAGYARRERAVLVAQSRIMSTMIAGGSNFPVARMQKRNNTADKRVSEFLEWERKTLNRLRNKYDPKRIARAPISSDDTDAVSKLQAKIDEAERLQELMKVANKVVRKKKLTDAEKVAGLVELGLSQAVAYKLLEPDFAGRAGFPSYRLTNNNANIRRIKQRITQLERQAQDTTTEAEIGEVKVIDNVEENRVQIIFPDKPNAEIRAKLKSNGFHWAPNWNGRPWQRKRNAQALQLAKSIASEY
jgi:hypothetical protein